MKETLSILRLKKNKKETRRIRGRRALTPMHHRRHRRDAKTRSHSKVGNGVQVLQSASSHDRREWQGENEDKHGGDKERKGHENSADKEQRENAEKHEVFDETGGTENTELSIHPGSLQELREVSQYNTEDDAANEQCNETEPEEEEPPF